jgi:hypothetical protein
MLLEAFAKFPKEAEIIGRIVAGYAQLEIDLVNCITSGVGKLDPVLKPMFLIKGETPRVRIGKALGLLAYRGAGLEKEFEAAVQVVFDAVVIRNRYAHCIWHDPGIGKLTFVNLEELAELKQEVNNYSDLTPSCVELDLLQLQERYAVYGSNYLRWLGMEIRTRKGELAKNPLFRPVSVPKPPDIPKLI